MGKTSITKGDKKGMISAGVTAGITITSTILVAFMSLIGTIYTAKANTNKIQHELDKHNAIQDTKMEELTREVRQHNDFAIRIPVIEQRVTALEKETFKKQVGA